MSTCEEPFWVLRGHSPSVKTWEVGLLPFLVDDKDPWSEPGLGRVTKSPQGVG